MSLDLLNRRVGPAHDQSLRVKVGGEYVNSVSELSLASLGPEVAPVGDTALSPMTNGLRTRFIPGGEQQLIFRMFRKDENAQYWDLLEKAQEKWEVEYCYCSVFDECWEVPGKWEEPTLVRACVRDEPNEFMP